MGTDGIEIPQQHHIPRGIRPVLFICRVEVSQNPLLGLSIGIRTLPLRAVLRNGNHRRVAVYRGGGRKDDILAPMLPHHIHKHKGFPHVVVILFPGLGDRLAHRL